MKSLNKSIGSYGEAIAEDYLKIYWIYYIRKISPVKLAKLI